MWVANLINRVKGWKHKHIETMRTSQQYHALMAKLVAADKGIEAGTFLPAAEGSWRCSSKWCEFFATCKFARREQ